MADFLIAAPPYSGRSGGIMILHELCTALNKLNHRAGVVFITEGSQAHQGFKFAFSADHHLHDPEGSYFDYFSGRTPSDIAAFISNAVVIYPDIVKGNPIGGKSYVSYVLGVPKFEVVAPFIITFSKLYTTKADGYLFKPFLSPHMTHVGSNHWTTRSLSLTYIGKGSKYLDCYVIPGTVLVERDWPRDKKQLGILLRNCKYFISWDCLSATNFDAVMCGAVPLLLHDLQIPREELNRGELGLVYPEVDNVKSILCDVRCTPQNIDSIDQVLDSSRDIARHYEMNWLANVESLANKILKGFD